MDEMSAVTQQRGADQRRVAAGGLGERRASQGVVALTDCLTAVQKVLPSIPATPAADTTR
jgi:hypothetical protein